MISNLKEGFLGFLLQPKTPEEKFHRAMVVGFVFLPVAGTLTFIIYAFMTMPSGGY